MGKPVRGLGCVCVCLWLAATTEAATPRAYVSVNGNDLNVCNVPASPCRTFTGAIGQVTPGGEVIVLDSGTFGGGTISQAVTINAPAGVAALAATPIVVSAGASDVVTLRGITFVSPSPGSGTALSYSAGGGLNVENCVFHGWNTGIDATAAGRLNVVDTTVRDSASHGISLFASSGTLLASIVRTRLLGNSYGLYVYKATATIKGSVAAGNFFGLAATSVDATNSEFNVENCLVTHNSGYGIYATGASGGGVVRVSGSTVTNNGTGLGQTSFGVLLSRVNNTVEGNSIDSAGTIGTLTAK
jgi:hypothetical protein